MKLDLTVLAVPAYFAAMGAEHAWQRAHPVAPGTRAGDYQTADTLASLAMVLRDVAAADTWSDRWSFLLRGPGWAAERRRELAGVRTAEVEPAGVA